MNPDDREKLRSKCHRALAENQGLVLASATELLKLLDTDAGIDQERELLWDRIQMIREENESLEKRVRYLEERAK